MPRTLMSMTNITHKTLLLAPWLIFIFHFLLTNLFLTILTLAYKLVQKSLEVRLSKILTDHRHICGFGAWNSIIDFESGLLKASSWKLLFFPFGLKILNYVYKHFLSFPLYHANFKRLFSMLWFYALSILNLEPWYYHI